MLIHDTCWAYNTSHRLSEILIYQSIATGWLNGIQFYTNCNRRMCLIWRSLMIIIFSLNLNNKYNHNTVWGKKFTYCDMTPTSQNTGVRKELLHNCSFPMAINASKTIGPHHTYIKRASESRNMGVNDSRAWKYYVQSRLLEAITKQWVNEDTADSKTLESVIGIWRWRRKTKTRSKSLWRGYINTIIMFVDIVHRPAFI
jgi:hypothetical protein